MNNSNIKVYLGISFALIILFLLILIILFTKKSTTQNNTTNSTNQQIFPTSVETNPSKISNLPTGQAGNPTPITVKADFTGAAEDQLPQSVIDLAAQKKDLRQKTPLSLSTFTIDFNYSEDKFVVTLKDPKDQAQKEFESWRTANYPGLDINQFLIK